ncbi:putative ribonuclease H-like domain-containing protein [Tanacetum coccineum]|uniref:Ribonuclease H-like domain-containing protein n=1 Tax=Tanacetum coccineum TaxID=301880 RepID=A0ABQ5I7V5_9ASTR
MVEEPLNMKKKDQVLFDEQEALRLQAQFDEEARIAREKEEANAALIAQWNDIQDKVETDYELAQRLQEEEQEELTIEEKSKLFVQILEARKKHFTAKRAEERRNRPQTKAQQRSFMCTYLKNMDGWKPKDLKNKSFKIIQDLFDKAMKRVNTFVDMETELVEGTEKKEGSKKAEAELDEKVEAKVDDAKEAEELKQCLEIVPDDGDEVTIDATPLSVKIPIIDYKIYQEGKKSFFKIIRAGGKTQMYLTFSKMVKNFDREDFEVLWRIVKARFKKTKPVNYMDTFLHLNLKTMFEHHVEDTFSDADHAGCIDTRKITSGGIQFLGDKLVSWMSKKQDCTAMSSTEAEYVALSVSCAQVMWMRTQLKDYGFNYNKILLYLRLSVSHSNLMQPCATLLYQAHQYSISLYQGTGLLGDDKEWDIALEESTTSATLKEIRILFVQILIYYNVADLKNNQITYIKRGREVVLEREWLDEHFRERKNIRESMCYACEQ